MRYGPFLRGFRKKLLDLEIEEIRSLYPEVMRRLREKQHLTVDMLATKLDVDPNEILAWEHGEDYRLTAPLLSKLSDVFNIPSQNLCMLAGALPYNLDEFLREVSKLVAKLEESSKVTRSRQQSLDEFINFLRSMPGETLEGVPCGLIPLHFDKGE